MPTRYVGPGGNDGNTGLSWALRKLTLTGVEASPVAAGDTVYVGPGTYRETLTCAVSGGAGNPITYIGDYTGANTDGVGGVVRITGSDNDQTATRNNCISANAKTYRSFTGFVLDGCVQAVVAVAGTVSNWTISECYVLGAGAAGGSGFIFSGALSNVVIQDCFMMSGGTNNSAWIRLGSAAQASSGNYVQNCMCIGAAYGMLIYSSGTTVRNCVLMCPRTIGIYADCPAGQSIAVNNCVLYGGGVALQAGALGELVEDYNNIYGANTARTNVNVGANSNAYPPLFDSRWFFELVNGGRMISPFDLASYSQLVNVAGWLPTATDMRGTAAIGGVREWGALEYDPTLLIESAGGGAVSISPYRGAIG